MIVHLLELDRRDVPDRLEQLPVVEPVDAFQGRELNSFQMTPASTLAHIENLPAFKRLLEKVQELQLETP